MDTFGQRVGQALHVESEEVDRFKRRLMRTKTIQSTSGDDEGDDGQGRTDKNQLDRCLTTLDLISLGVGSCCGTGMYVVAGLVAKNVAGPSTILSFIIAAFASILSGVCYGEFGVRVPKTTGSAYMYSYVAVGEFVAFLIGWNLILEYMIGSAAGASALSACFDALINHTMSADLEANVGTVIGKTYPDFLGCAIGIAMTVVLAVGVKKSVRFNNVLNVINFLVWIFIVFAGMFYVDTSNWRDYGFAPYGASGVFSGAATCFYAFIGFDIIATTGEEAKNPSRSIPIAIVVSLCACLTAYITCSLVLTLMVPYSEIHGDSALIDMFVQNGAPGAKFVVAIGAMCALTVSLLGSMFPMPRVIYAMSRDGLLFQFLSEVHPYTGTPLVTTIMTGLLASLMALLVGLRILVEMMSIGTLLAYTLVSASALILRYQPSLHDIEIPMAHKLDTIDEGPDDLLSPVESESGGILGGTGNNKQKLKDKANLIGTDNGQKSYGSLPFGGAQVESGLAYVQRHFKIWWLRCGFPSDDALPNQSTAKTVIIFVGVLAIFQLATCLLIVFGGHLLARGEPWSVIVLLCLIAAIVACLVVIVRQPQNRRTLDFMAPAVPFLPALAIFINMYLMLKLPGLTWARLGVWICIGLLLYFSYSMWHSVKERKKAVPEQPKPSDQVGEGFPDKLPMDGTGQVSAITTSEGYGYDQGGPINITGPAPPAGRPLPNSTDASAPSPWQPIPATATNTNASSPWRPQNEPTPVQPQTVSASGFGPGNRTSQSGRTLVRRQSSEKPPRPKNPPRRQSTEGSDRSDRPPPPPRRQSTESSANSSPWTSEDRSDPWQPVDSKASPWQSSESSWQQSDNWQPRQQQTERSRHSPDPWGRSPNVASNNPFWNAMQ